jgi:hypothetical protein
MLFTRFILPGTMLKNVLGSSQVPKEPHRTSALFFDPGRTSTPSLRGASVLPPSFGQRRLQRHSISRLNRTALILTVYASCRPRERLRKTRFRWVANLFRVGLYYPLGPDEQFPLALPLLLGFSWRDQSLSCWCRHSRWFHRACCRLRRDEIASWIKSIGNFAKGMQNPSKLKLQSQFSFRPPHPSQPGPFSSCDIRKAASRSTC